MPRQLRFVVAGVAAHITQRGHNGADCFTRDSDYLIYLLHLRATNREAPSFNPVRLWRNLRAR